MTFAEILGLIDVLSTALAHVAQIERGMGGSIPQDIQVDVLPHMSDAHVAAAVSLADEATKSA